MDPLDLAILREMARDRAALWGSLDPRLSPALLARRLGVDSTTVRDRLRAWERRGFLLGYQALPNPSLFGARVAVCAVRTQGPREKPGFVEALPLLDGAMAALDHVGPWIGVGLIDEGPAVLARRQRLLARLPGVVEVAPPFPGVERPATVEPTAADWRLLAALRARPRASLADLAKETGLSTKTVARRYGRLVRGRAVWTVPQLDFAGYKDAVFAHLIVHHAAGRGDAAVAPFAQAYPHHIDALSTEGPDGAARELFVHLPSAAEVERAEALLLAVPGVSEVETLFPRRFVSFPGWFDERLARLKQGQTLNA